MRPTTTFFLFFIFCVSVKANHIFITNNGNGTKAGNSWANAKEGATSLNSLIAAANAGDSLFIAEGQYIPSANINVAAAINLKSGVSLFGGFPTPSANMLNPTWANRNAHLYPTILSGDIDNNDWDSDNDPYTQIADDIIGSNSNNVLILPAATANVLVDGFIISGGDAKTGNGGGIYSDYNAAVTFKNCFITGNKGTQGGGLYNYFSHPNSLVIGCTFSGNFANDGGAVFNHANSKTAFKKCIFSENIANNNGGAIANNYSSVITISGSIINNNTAAFGGGIYNYTSSINILNNVIVENNGTNGGGIYNYNSSTLISNCTIAGNYVVSNGGGITNAGNSSPKIRNSILSGNATNDMWNMAAFTPLLYNSIVSIYNNNVCTSCPGNAGHTDPQFVNLANAKGADNIWMTNDDGLRLKPCSPAINAGNNLLIPASITTDAKGVARVQQIIVDLGAYEMLDFGGAGYNSTTDAANQSLMANEECIDANGWTHYYDTTSKKVVLSLFKNGYDIGSINDGVFTVSSNTTNNYGTGQGTIINAPYTLTGDFVAMNRWWNVTPHPQLPLGNTGVKVRTYFTNADTTDVNGSIPGINNDITIPELHFYKINDYNTSLNPDGNPATADAHAGVDMAQAYDEPGYWQYDFGVTSSTSTWALGKFNNLKFAEYEIAKFSGGGGGFSGAKGQVFPVELLSFEVLERNDGYQAVWATTKEENTQLFDIERSTDGYLYELIGSVMAAGYSDEEKHYDFTDFSAPTGNNYYRLRMVDTDGKFSYSHIVTVGHAESTVNVYPNPATNMVMLEGEILRNGTVLINNSLGQTMKELKMGDERSSHIDISQWERGFYFLQLFDEKGHIIRSEKIVAQ